MGAQVPGTCEAGARDVEAAQAKVNPRFHEQWVQKFLGLARDMYGSCPQLSQSEVMVACVEDVWKRVSPRVPEVSVS